MSIKVGPDHVVRTSFLTSNCLHVFSWIECIHCQTEASQQPSADHMTVVSHTHLHVLSNHSPHTHVCTHGHTHTHTCTTSPATDYFTASLDYRKWRNVNAVTHTHRHTPSWVAFPSNTKLWLSRERERGRVHRHKWGSCWRRWERQSQRETHEQRSTCQSGWTLNSSKTAAEWVQRAGRCHCPGQSEHCDHPAAALAASAQVFVNFAPSESGCSYSADWLESFSVCRAGFAVFSPPACLWCRWKKLLWGALMLQTVYKWWTKPQWCHWSFY